MQMMRQGKKSHMGVDGVCEGQHCQLCDDEHRDVGFVNANETIIHVISMKLSGGSVGEHSKWKGNVTFEEIVRERDYSTVSFCEMVGSLPLKKRISDQIPKWHSPQPQREGNIRLGWQTQSRN
jgi:hypothetical protein